ncbi:uncharacterized protein [Dysidea avara]|uniref:uncharacterized protein n=1 Tax=Dysidea avara TaxID=196820 RepID=UPI0033196716
MARHLSGTLLTAVFLRAQCLDLFCLSSLYVNDIPDLVESKIKMFADNIKIYKQITSFGDALSLQNDLDKLCDWAKEWLLHFNVVKCKHLKYGNNASPYEYYMNDEGTNTKLGIVSSEKDLGVWITSKPNFALQCDKASAKAMQSLGLIKRTFTHLTKESFLILYKTYVRPHLEYCVSIWNPFLAQNIDKLERIQQRATKLVPELAQLPYETRLQHLDLLSLFCRRQREFHQTHSSPLLTVLLEDIIRKYLSTTPGSTQD